MSKKFAPAYANNIGSRGLMNRVEIVTQRSQVRVSGLAGIVDGGSECPALSPSSIPRLR